MERLLHVSSPAQDCCSIVHIGTRSATVSDFLPVLNMVRAIGIGAKLYVDVAVVLCSVHVVTHNWQ